MRICPQGAQLLPQLPKRSARELTESVCKTFVTYPRQKRVLEKHWYDWILGRGVRIH